MNAKKNWLNAASIVFALIGVAFIALSLGKVQVDFDLKFPWWFSIIFFVAACVCGYFAMKLSDTAEKQKALSHMVGRPALSEKEFGRQFFPNDRAEIAAKLREILSRYIPIDLSQVQPNDCFVEDLRMDALDSMSTVEYVIEIEKEFGIKIPDSAAEKMITFQSVVDYVSEAVKSKAN
jgi:acyl carrier protein